MVPEAASVVGIIVAAAYRAAPAWMVYPYERNTKMEGKTMCYGIRELTGKKTREAQ